jgi:hypothetical protein
MRLCRLIFAPLAAPFAIVPPRRADPPIAIYPDHAPWQLQKKFKFTHNLLPDFVQYVTEQRDLTLRRFHVIKSKWSYQSWLTGHCKETRDNRNSPLATDEIQNFTREANEKTT